MKRKFPKWILFLAIPCVLVAAGYFALMQYYKGSIPYGTWVNNIYCTGMSYDEVAELLLENNTYFPEIDVMDKDGKVYHLVPDKETYSLSYKENLEKEIASYGAAKLFTEKHITLTPKVTVHGPAWSAYIQSQPPFSIIQNPPEETRVYILDTDTGFELVDFCLNNLDKEKASQVIMEAMEAGESRVSLAEKDCYFDLPHTEEEKKIIAKYEALQTFCSQITMNLTIQGETVYTVDASVIKNWILEEENGEYSVGKGGGFLLDEKKVEEYAQSISDEVTTYWGKPWQFVNHDGETIEVNAGNYGRALKTKELSAKLIHAFQTGSSEPYELEFQFYPASSKEVEYGAGYGDSYVEVDIENQHVYVYLEGELALDSPCVTGDVKRHRETPKGTFYIEYKQRNRTLRGEDYATPVSYWMHFYNHCGFHDAGWRRSFGEDIYISNGSHGCVNMPPKKAKEMYELVYKGMPVFVY